MDKKELKKIFIEFLIKEGCLFSYYEYCVISFDELYSDLNKWFISSFNGNRQIHVEPINFLVLSFHFRQTKEGNNYWWRKHHKWKKYYNERNNKIKMKK